MIKKLLVSIFCLILASTVIVLIGIHIFTPYVDPMNTDRYISYPEWKPGFLYTATINDKTTDPFAHYKESDTALTKKADYHSLGDVSTESAVLEARYRDSFWGSSQPIESVILRHPELSDDDLTASLPLKEITITIKTDSKKVSVLTLPTEMASTMIWEPLQQAKSSRDIFSTNYINYHGAGYYFTTTLKLGRNGLIHVPLSIYMISDGVWACSLDDANRDDYAYRIFLDNAVRDFIQGELDRLKQEN